MSLSTTSNPPDLGAAEKPLTSTSAVGTHNAIKPSKTVQNTKSDQKKDKGKNSRRTPAGSRTKSKPKSCDTNAPSTPLADESILSTPVDEESTPSRTVSEENVPSTSTPVAGKSGRRKPIKFPKRLLKCDLCEKVFSKGRNLKQHMFLHTGQRPFPCDEPGCGKSYTNIQHLRRHQQTNHKKQDQETQVHVCNLCYRTYTLLHNLKRHMKRTHEKGENPFLCNICFHGFKKHYQLKEHEYRHTGIPAFKCSQSECGEVFRTNRELKKHLQLHFGYRCEFPNCNFTSRYKLHLNVHHREQHREEHKFICRRQGCHYVADQKYTLRRHERTHDPYRQKFGCPMDGCERSYFRMSTLQTHIKTAHMGKRYECPHPKCNLTYTALNNVRHHYRMAHSADPLPRLGPRFGPRKPRKDKGSKKTPLNAAASRAVKLSQVPLEKIGIPEDEISGASELSEDEDYIRTISLLEVTTVEPGSPENQDSLSAPEPSLPPEQIGIKEEPEVIVEFPVVKGEETDAGEVGDDEEDDESECFELEKEISDWEDEGEWSMVEQAPSAQHPRPSS
ncbi:unnamed protein product [Cyprideis torosa]|uniref:Uncharacterized protein n=1 Tax=Cyprideis torosa TaxID=163714 RepID=A0A7R8W497_9CRUS|nr:unnamed protein product [Cyprideis torosa]CAG0880398.1 unnamed protein product [Cyprideis torosa]